MQTVWCEPTFFEFQVFWIIHLGPDYMSASVTAGVMSKKNLAMPEETDHVTKWISWSTFQFAGPELVIICSSMGQHPVSTYKYAEPKLRCIVPKVAYQYRYANSRHLLCKTFLSFEKATTGYPTFSQHFLITWTQEQAVRQYKTLH